MALETYDLVQLEDVLEYLKKKFKEFKANEEKCRGEAIYFKHFEGNCSFFYFKIIIDKWDIAKNSCER